MPQCSGFILDSDLRDRPFGRSGLFRIGCLGSRGVTLAALGCTPTVAVLATNSSWVVSICWKLS